MGEAAGQQSRLCRQGESEQQNEEYAHYRRIPSRCRMGFKMEICFLFATNVISMTVSKIILYAAQGTARHVALLAPVSMSYRRSGSQTVFSGAA